MSDDVLVKAKDTCPVCGSPLTDATVDDEGVKIKVKHCKTCYKVV